MIIGNFKFSAFEIFRHESAKLEESSCLEFSEAVINVWRLFCINLKMARETNGIYDHWGSYLPWMSDSRGKY